MTCGIYAICNLVNGKVYIGSSKNIENRWVRHRCNLDKGKHINRHLQGAWLMYGKESFALEVLEVMLPTEIIAREQHYLDEMKPEYNISRSSRRPDVEITDDHKRRISQANTGRVKTEEQRRRISEGTKRGMARPEIQKRMAEVAEENRGRRHTEEHRRKISESQKGRPGVNIGRKLSEEWKANIAAGMRGKKFGPISEERRRNISEAVKASNARRRASANGGSGV